MVDYFRLIIKTIFSLIFILGLIILVFKYGGGKLQLLTNKKYLKILERITLSKENSLLVVKMGTKAFVVSSTHSNVEILREISEEDLIKLEMSVESPKNYKLMELIQNWRKKED